MLKIGEFSKLSHLTIKALRFYEKEGLLIPSSIDEWNGYRYYETDQLRDAANILTYRQLGLSIEEIKSILSGSDKKEILTKKAIALAAEREALDMRLSILNYILEEKEMKYQVSEKIIPSAIVYYSEATLDSYGDIMEWIPSLGAECLKLNPNIKCAEPNYEFCEYLDIEYKEKDVRIRHNEAVTSFGVENDIIKFKEIPETKVLSIYHKGAYEKLPEAYSYLFKYAEDNGYECNGLSRECYIDGIWNKDNIEDWLTEIQLPIK